MTNILEQWISERFWTRMWEQEPSWLPKLFFAETSCNRMSTLFAVDYSVIISENADKDQVLEPATVYLDV